MTISQPMTLTAAQCRAARALAGIEQSRIADAAGINRRAVSLFEQGKTRPHQGTIERLIAAFSDAGVRFTDDPVGVFLDPDSLGDLTDHASI